MLTFTFHASPMIGYGADDPGFFVPVFVVWIFLSGWKSEDKVFIVSLFLQ